jgi:hypothetical protein
MIWSSKYYTVTTLFDSECLYLHKFFPKDIVNIIIRMLLPQEVVYKLIWCQRRHTLNVNNLKNGGIKALIYNGGNGMSNYRGLFPRSSYSIGYYGFTSIEPYIHERYHKRTYTRCGTVMYFLEGEHCGLLENKFQHNCDKCSADISLDESLMHLEWYKIISDPTYVTPKPPVTYIPRNEERNIFFY